jgi:hypothetical protein
LDDALRLAVKEDPSNDFGELLKNLPKAIPITGTPKAVAFYGKKWSQRKELRVKFLEGERGIQQKIRKHAEVWMDHANIRFKFVESGEAEIRISFNRHSGSWSHIGTDNLIVPPDRPTMNFAWLSEASSENDYASVVLHEFGHALFLGHEHQRPDIGTVIVFERAQVIKDCWARMGWSAQEVEEQILTRYDRNVTIHDKPDLKSIMMYAFPANWNTKGIGTPWNTKLSDADIAFIKHHYPKS